MANPIDHNKYIDGADIMDRFNELEGAERLEDDNDSMIAEGDPEAAEENFWLDDDGREELELLRVLVDLCERATGSCDGVRLISEDYFEEYAEDYARSIGAINEDFAWPYNNIDWKAAAEDLMVDYTLIEWEGTTYWVR